MPISCYGKWFFDSSLPFNLVLFCFFFHSYSLVADYNVIDWCGTYTSIGSWLIHNMDDLKRTRITINMILNHRMELTCISASAGRFLLVFNGAHIFSLLAVPFCVRFDGYLFVNMTCVLSVGNALRTPHFDPYVALYCNR